MMRHNVQVENYLGTNAVGEVYGRPYEVPCMLVEQSKMVRNAQGEDVSSSSRYIAAPGHNPPENSRVTLDDGVARKVISVTRATWPKMSVPANTEVSLD
jgi:hypothetical protein